MRRINVPMASLAVLCFVVLSGFVTTQNFKKLSSRTFGGLVDLDTVFLKLDDCSAKGKVCLPLNLGQALRLKITDNGTPVNIDITNGCDYDTTSAYTYSTLFGSGTLGPYQLTSWPVSGQVFSDTFHTMPELVDSMNNWDPLGNWVLDADHQLITGGFPGNVYDTMKVWVISIQTPSFIGYNYGTTPRGTEVSFGRGFHTVILEDTINMMSDTFYVHATCGEQVDYTIQLDSTGTHCLDFGDLLGGVQSVGICNPAGANAVFSLINNDSCLQFTGTSVGVSTTCVVACDSTGYCDTTYVTVRVKGEGASYFHYIEIPTDFTGTVCLDTANLNGSVETIQLCPSDMDEYVEFSLTNNMRCIQYTGLAEGGTDTMCIIACDGQGLCDTTTIAVKVRRFGPQWVYDTLYLNQSGIACTDPSLLPGNPQALEVIMEPIPQMLFYNLDQTDFCINYTGLKPGVDTIGVRLRDDGSQFDSLFVVVTILKPDTEVIYDTLEIGEQRYYCLDTTQLSGTNFVLDNICKNSSNEDVLFNLNDVSLCLEIQAIDYGTDTACITLCDNYGICDTLILIVTAFDQVVGPQAPVAFADNAISENSQPVFILVLNNDVITTDFTDILVLPANGSIGPAYGTTTVDTVNGNIVYTPNDGICNVIDDFRYVVCNLVGCDTATVTIVIECDTTANKPFQIFDGFSPNGDNVNDTFVIQGIDQFPGNKVRIFNRWGNLILERENYKNDWNGTWEAQPIPDGTYFYIFESGTGKVQNGTITIRR